MTFIIDTHIFLWALADPDQLTSEQRNLLMSRTNTVYLSAVSIAELMIKVSLGKLEMPFDPKEMALATGIDILDYRGDDALLLRDLPFHHRDPFDRMIITQSLAHGYPIMTVDGKFSLYPCKLL